MKEYLINFLKFVNYFLYIIFPTTSEVRLVSVLCISLYINEDEILDEILRNIGKNVIILQLKVKILISLVYISIKEASETNSWTFSFLELQAVY